jgi:hypothetical protein
MVSSSGRRIPAHSPALYEIRIQGSLDPSWTQLMDGLSLTTIEQDGEPVTVLRVVVPDQAALAGLLDSLFRLNTTVLSVEVLEAR